MFNVPLDTFLVAVSERKNIFTD